MHYVYMFNTSTQHNIYKIENTQDQVLNTIKRICPTLGSYQSHKEEAN